MLAASRPEILELADSLTWLAWALVPVVIVSAFAVWALSGGRSTPLPGPASDSRHRRPTGDDRQRTTARRR